MASPKPCTDISRFDSGDRRCCPSILATAQVQRRPSVPARNRTAAVRGSAGVGPSPVTSRRFGTHQWLSQNPSRNSPRSTTLSRASLSRGPRGQFPTSTHRPKARRRVSGSAPFQDRTTRIPPRILPSCAVRRESTPRSQGRSFARNAESMTCLAPGHACARLPKGSEATISALSVLDRHRIVRMDTKAPSSARMVSRTSVRSSREWRESKSFRSLWSLSSSSLREPNTSSCRLQTSRPSNQRDFRSRSGWSRHSIAREGLGFPGRVSAGRHFPANTTRIKEKTWKIREAGIVRIGLARKSSPTLVGNPDARKPHI
jgi:hypothetical protein